MSALYTLHTGSGFKQFPYQPVNLVDIRGQQVTVSLKEIDQWTHAFDIQFVAIGVSLGLSLGLLFVMIGYAILEPKYLRRPIYILSTICLLVVAARAIVNSILTTGGFDGFAAFKLGVNPSGQSLLALLVINAFSLPVLYATIIATLILQVRIVLSMNKRSQRVVTIALSSIATLLLGFSIARKRLYINSLTKRGPKLLWMDRIILLALLVVLGSCAIIFLVKLVHLIRQRRLLGLTGFGVLHILSIMSCQCLIVPSTLPLSLDANGDSCFLFPNLCCNAPNQFHWRGGSCL
jgi:hypothetical protein